MDGCALLALAVPAGVATLIAALWWLMSVLDKDAKETTERLNAEIAERQAKFKEEDKFDGVALLTDVWKEYLGYFPYVPKPHVKDRTPEAVTTGIKVLIHSLPMYGEIPSLSGMPAPALPERERLRHMYVVGKSGSGKSTFLEHVVLSDLSAGHGVCVMSPEGELFRRRLLPLIPEDRIDDVIYFAPADPENMLSFNPLALEPGDDANLAADELFTIIKRVFADIDLGARMQSLLHNAFGALVGREGATLWDVKRLLQDDAFRMEVVADAESYIQDFWLTTYPAFPKDAALPVIHRLDRFLRPKQLRCLLYPQSSFSVRDVLATGKILFLDLYGLSEGARLLLGQLMLSKFQLEIMRREAGARSTKPFYVFADEFQSFAGSAEATWRELLSRGRKYGLALTVAHQYPAQVPSAVRNEIFGNVGSVVSFKLGAKGAGVLRQELLTKTEKSLEPLPATTLLELSVGEAVMRLGGGQAVTVKTPPPVAVLNPSQAAEVISASRAQYGSTTEPVTFEPDSEPLPDEPESWLE